MRIPKHLLIYGEKYSLKQDSGLERRELMGECSPERQTLTYCPKITKESDIMDTIGHEIAHAYIFESGFHHLIDSNTEELICDLVGRIIRDHFKFK